MPDDDSIPKPPQSLKKQFSFTKRLRSLSSPPPISTPAASPRNGKTTSGTSTPVNGSPKPPPSRKPSQSNLKRSASGPTSSSWTLTSPRGRSPTIVSYCLGFPEFKQLDLHPQRQRRILGALQKMHATGAVVTEKGGRKEKESGRERTRKASVPKIGSDEKKSALTSKLQSLLKSKKPKRSKQDTFHRLHLSILDHRTSIACTLLDDISPSTLLKYRGPEPNNIFLSAMVSGLEPVCLIMLDKGYPTDVNAPVYNRKDKNDSRVTRFEPPSYFLLAVGLGLHNVVFRMIQNHRVKLNLTWYGITPLHLACSKNALSLVRMLLEHGANPRQALPYSNYRLLRRLKRSQPRLSNLRERGRGPGGKTGKVFTEGPPLKGILPLDIAAVLGSREVAGLLLSRMQPSMLPASTIHILAQSDMDVRIGDSGAKLELD